MSYFGRPIIALYYRVAVEPGMTNDEIKAAARKSPNGHFCETICRKCGGYTTTAMSLTESATILTDCPLCRGKEVQEVQEPV